MAAAAAACALDKQLVFGLNPPMVLRRTFIRSVISSGQCLMNVLFGLVHLVVFAVFVFPVFVS